MKPEQIQHQGEPMALNSSQENRLIDAANVSRSVPRSLTSWVSANFRRPRLFSSASWREDVLPLLGCFACALAWSVQAESPKFLEVNGLLASAATNSPADAHTNLSRPLDDKYRLAIGDRLSFKIVEDEEDAKPFIVTDSGDVDFPYIGRVPVVGKTCRELARSLKTQLEKDYYYHATVILAVDSMTRSRGKIYLVGAVRIPGPEEVPSDEVLTLSKAILRAGGFTEFADKHKVKLTRQSRQGSQEDQVFTVDVAQILEAGKSELDVPLEPGDLIYISDRLIRF